MQLKSPIDLNGDSVEKVELPERNIRHNVRAVVAGWGLIENQPERSNQIPRFPDVLQKLSVLTVGRFECKILYEVNTDERSDSFCAHRNRNKGFGICEVKIMNSET